MGAGAGPTGAYMRAEEPEDNILRTRTYDLYMTYDQYYQVCGQSLGVGTRAGGVLGSEWIVQAGGGSSSVPCSGPAPLPLRLNEACADSQLCDAFSCGCTAAGSALLAGGLRRGETPLGS